MNYKENLTESIYQVFTRNHSAEGTFSKVTKDIPRIAEMGFDYLYLLPFHPNSEKGRKGDLGSPYAISDYYAVDPAYGDLTDLQELVESAHNHGLKVMIDIVINHTGRDHRYTIENPEYYYHNEKGDFINRVEDWYDVYDLNYSNQALRQELIDMLTYWAKFGIDAYRCDVGSLVPVDFWVDAKAAVREVNPDHFWLAESCHGEFIFDLRSRGYEVASDAELYQAFDCLYNYDIHDTLLPTLRQELGLMELKKRYRYQEWSFPSNYLKLNCLENHDQPRIQGVLRDRIANRNWTAFSFFNKGLGFVYAGQEFFSTKQPSLFTKDLIEEMHQEDHQMDFIASLINMKKSGFIERHTRYEMILNEEECLVSRYETNEEYIYGIFNVKNINTKINIGLDDGLYNDVIIGEAFTVEKGYIDLASEPVIFRVKK
ncbi:alpha-amylase family glycosyl hydrolase [Erysipelothrix urinaevulpis]|uniref:alpha-amylase family glycosyl hydrolase n=1 Tax=Erysipelothrix urinaevulpis TaxID=2683717 RepID=UPI0013576815|nr:alpha-amylase family glycosyl hydrolase [Erysipelothrix urinaevulpis]